MENEDINLEEEVISEEPTEEITEDTTEEPTIEPTIEPTEEPKKLIYFNQDKQALGYEIEEPLCVVEEEIWQEFSTLILGTDYDITEDGIVDLREPIEVRELKQNKRKRL